MTSVTIALALVASALFLWMLQSDVDAANFTRVETSNVRLDAGAGWFDPRWQGLVQERIGALAPFDSDDPAQLETVAAQLRALPFVRSVAAPQVLWPDGVRVALELRPPIACVRVGREFIGIASDGMLLPGTWPAPPAFGQGYLPEIVQGEGSTRLRPGAVLWNDAVADALSVASSMWAELDPEDLARLGRTLIDARKARRASVEEPGTVIYLEYSRRILFGRAPSTREPGELPVEKKWLHVANALLCLPAGPPELPGGAPTARPGDVDWELVEVRWDHAAMLPRGGLPDGRVPVQEVKTARAHAPKPHAPEASRKSGLVR